MDPKILKKFSETSKRIITFAQKIANDYKKAIGSEHLLLAILTTPNTIASEILKDYAIGFEQIKLIISNQSEVGIASAGISDESKKVLELSVEKAIETKQNQVSPEHILYALVTIKDSNAYKILSQLNVDPEKIKEIINEILFDLGQVKMTAQKFIQDNFFPAFDIAPFNQGHKNSDRFQKNNKSYLEKFGVNLTEQAKNNLLDPVFERDEELFRVLQILNRRTKNNPILVGQAGVGKTAIVEGLAQLIIEKKVPQTILNKQIWQIDLALLVAGTTFRGQFEERIKGLLKDIEKNPNLILFIDEIHTLVGTGNSEGSMDASNILKPALAKGKIRLIGATTDDEYRQYIEKDPALTRRMQKVYISEPSLETTEKILQKIKIKYEAHHQIKIPDQLIPHIVMLADRYIHDRNFPDKAIDIIDEAAASVQLQNIDQLPISVIDQLQNKLDNILKLKDQAIQNQNFDKAAKIREKEVEILKQISIENNQPKKVKFSKAITIEDIYSVISLWTTIPKENISHNISKNLSRLALTISHSVIGQKHAIDSIFSVLKRSFSHLSNIDKPLGSFIFTGPSGVGKTFLASQIAHNLFGSEDNLIRFDMSEFSEKHTVSRLIGAPPGYVGYENAGELTEKLRKKPYSLILFDEIEKAHPEVINLLMQILDNGYLTDSMGKKINFNQSIIIATSNLSVNGNLSTNIGFNSHNNSTIIESNIIEKLKNHLSNELVNRFNQVVIFNELTENDLITIIKLWINEFNNNKAFGYSIEINKNNLKYIISKYYINKEGVRSLHKFFNHVLESKILDLDYGKIKSKKIKLKINNFEISITKK
ncbi:MAG: ATPase AAA-2 domain protein [Berkelbacteria bacterium GW2011_GWA2_35_9]|uniref:ATPase AAA-2 domain protein n=1 Tax=Berkelbacteria bacterium GW2011_GWA2_35_9 TaxID=1618333 RepID=A0A0G0DK04_9BACT|nr:MAG: ATPase AAA-2 domain protein [Berkelbacteria bacterium GW2011_GWA2_35_9]